MSVQCPRCGNDEQATIGGSVNNDVVTTWWCSKCEHTWPRRFNRPDRQVKVVR